jgi:hypothetical protein
MNQIGDPALRARAKSNNAAKKRGGNSDRPMDSKLKIKFKVYASTTVSVAAENRNGSTDSLSNDGSLLAPVAIIRANNPPRTMPISG